jgi:hypothetical protein
MIKEKGVIMIVTVKDLIQEFEEKLNRTLEKEEIDLVNWIVHNQPHRAFAIFA